MEDISKIYQTDPIIPDKPEHKNYEKKRRKRKKRSREAREHFDELTRMVDDVHRELEDNKSPFRLCVFQEGDDIFIDVVTVNDSGNTTRVFRHDISRAEVEEILQQIRTGTGLLLNADA